VPEKPRPGGAPRRCCAPGITTYSPLRHWKVRNGQKVGVVGLGGLGHMGVKSRTRSARGPSVFTTSAGQDRGRATARSDEVVVSSDAAEMAKHAGTFDFILDTVVRRARPERLPRAPEAGRAR
jgi:uncharacterized zinc-type alcohol dehydrogenase-like protein